MATTYLPASISLIYGPSKDGKTVAAIAAFPRGYFIGKRQAFECAAVLGISLLDGQIGTASTIEELIALLPRVAAMKGPDGRPTFDAVIGDDLTIIVDVTVLQAQKKYTNERGQLNGQRMWGYIRDRFIELRLASEESGLPVIFTTHAKSPAYFGEDDKEVQAGTAAVGKLKDRGGPRLPGRMPEDMPAIANLVLRVEKQKAASSLLPPGYWPSVFRLAGDEPWITGDRSDTAFDGAPLNLRELFREAARRASIATGHNVLSPARRWPGLEWQEAAVERLAPILVEHGFGPCGVGTAVDWDALITNAEADVRTRYGAKNERHVRWAVSDALAAAQYRWMATQQFKRYGIVAKATGVFG